VSGTSRHGEFERLIKIQKNNFESVHEHKQGVNVGRFFKNKGALRRMCVLKLWH
jgi:hypothetical protein